MGSKQVSTPYLQSITNHLRKSSDGDVLPLPLNLHKAQSIQGQTALGQNHSSTTDWLQILEADSREQPQQRLHREGFQIKPTYAMNYTNYMNSRNMPINLSYMKFYDGKSEVGKYEPCFNN
jgi:hypothetical protein